jgi:hypothetical protein
MSDLSLQPTASGCGRAYISRLPLKERLVWFRTHPILRVLDDCASSFNFPVLDNGYVYLAASRLSAYAAPPDWALVIEIFGFSPRTGLPAPSCSAY